MNLVFSGSERASILNSVEKALDEIRMLDAQCGADSHRFDGPKRETDATRSYEKEQEKRRHQDEEGELEEGLEDTFPASDPVAPTSTTTSGGPKRKN